MQDVHEEKDLGVIIDQDLKFHRQTAAAVKKANVALGLIKRSFVFLNNEIMPLLFKSLVRPHLEYGNVIWGPFYKGDAEKVERIQRRATRISPGLKSLTYAERLRLLRLPSMQHRRRRGDMIMTYKIMTGKVNLDKGDFFSLAPNTTNRGSHIHKLAKPKATKTVRQNAFSTRVIDDWNGLTKEIVTAKTTNAFKNALDDHWETEQFATPFDQE